MKTALIVIGIVCAALFVLFLIYLALIAPGKKRRADLQPFLKSKYAHRGLHNEELPENSLAAFAAAVDAGYGIELDVRLSADGELVVFHDDTLERVSTESGRVDAKSAKELGEIKLCTTEHTIPTFAEVLKLVDGRVPLLVEIKEDVFKYGVTEKAAEMLKEYKGPFIVESFNPLALMRFRKLFPAVPLGLLCDNFLKEKKYRKPMYFVVQFMLLNFLSRPEFIAYNHQEWRNPPIRVTKFFFPKTPRFAWTVASEADETAARSHGFDSVIFEKYLSNPNAKEEN